jgi:hypothetical protein
MDGADAGAYACVAGTGIGREHIPQRHRKGSTATTLQK